MTDCLRCKDWERMGLSATCPTCDQRMIEMENLRAKSDALLEACGWEHGQDKDGTVWWKKPDGGYLDAWTFDQLPHPYANAQDAIDLAEAMGLKISDIVCRPEGWAVRLREAYHDEWTDWQPTIAEAISAAIMEAMTKGLSKCQQ